MLTMGITLEDVTKKDEVDKIIRDNSIIVGLEKTESDGLYYQLTGNVLVLNSLYGYVLKINRRKSANWFEFLYYKIIGYL